MSVAADVETSQIPVAIVGGGPVGLMLALLLDRHGVRCVLFNTEETTRWHPKGSSQGARTMEHYRRLGIADHVRTLGMPADHPTDVIYFTRFGGWELARLPMPSTAEKLKAIAAAAKTDQVPEPLHRANQMYVEKFLLEHVRTRPNIVVRFGWRVDDFADDGDGVTAQCRLRAQRQARELAQRLPRRLRRRARHGAARARHSLFRRRVAAGLYGRPHVLDPCAGADAGARLPAQERRLPILGDQSGAAHDHHLGQRRRRIHVLD